MYSSGNYGGPLGASSLAKGVVGNKSLRVLLDIFDYTSTLVWQIAMFPWKPDVHHSSYQVQNIFLGSLKGEILFGEVHISYGTNFLSYMVTFFYPKKTTQFEKGTYARNIRMYGS